jgi:O-methyltransferase involved in polyketide biosynthesis
VARVYDFWLGGKDNYEVDREEAVRLQRLMPRLDLRLVARENRGFLRRAVGYLAAAGVGQFLDLGAGLPTGDNTHQIAQRVHPAARVVYVDTDPIVLAHGRALLAVDEHTAIAEADLRSPKDVLDHGEVARLIDFDRPVGVLLVAVLHFLSDERAGELVARVVERAAPGSYLVISHGLRTPATERVAAVYAAAEATVRSRQEIAAFFEGLELVEPGLVPLSDWRPALARSAGQELPVLCGVGRK